MNLIPQLSLVAPPVAEPVTPAMMLTQLGMSQISDQGLADQLTAQLEGPIVAARMWCEKYEKRAYGLQTWMAQYDRFPRHPHEYDRHGKPSIRLSLPPFQSIVSFRYVDLTGTLVDLPEDTTFGSGQDVPAYTYQLQPGNQTQRARLSPGVYRWWPPTLHGADGAVQITFQCGFTTVPGNVLQAIKLLAQFFYEQGGATDLAIPRQITNLLSTPTKGS